MSKNCRRCRYSYEQQQKRMEYLERSNNRREDIIIEQRQEISDLEDKWDELKEYINTIYKGCPPHEKEVLMFLTDKMQKLEGSDSNVKD